MALQSSYEGSNFLFSLFPETYRGLSGNSGTIDANGEYVASIGEIYIEDKSASKTFSSSGGKVVFYVNSRTMTDVGTNVRIGVQDVSATTGLGDGTFDVYGDATSSSPLAAGWNTIAMTSGSKTISHGDKISIQIEMTARGGADTVAILQLASGTIYAGSMSFPYRVTNGTKAGSNVIIAYLIFDDGSIGYINGAKLLPISAETGVTYNSGSANNERGFSFKLPFKCKINGIYMSAPGAAAAYELNVYTTPFGTPTLHQSITMDTDILASTGNTFKGFHMINPLTIDAEADVVVAYYATTATNITFTYATTVYAEAKKFFNFSVDAVRRSNSGNPAFSTYDSTHVPGGFGLLITELDDGVSTGGGGSYVF